MAKLLKEEHIKLAINTYNSGLFISKITAVKVFNILPRILTWLNKIASWKEVITNYRKLIDLKKLILKKINYYKLV
jgi:hypothetical protein